MTPERERLVRAVEEAHHIEDKVFAVYDEVSDKTIEAEAALAAYIAAHPEEDK